MAFVQIAKARQEKNAPAHLWFILHTCTGTAKEISKVEAEGNIWEKLMLRKRLGDAGDKSWHEQDIEQSLEKVRKHKTKYWKGKEA